MNRRKRSLDHLTAEEHAQIAAALRKVQDDLTAVSAIVGRAAFSDDVLRCQKRVQELLINPLLIAWDNNNDQPASKNPYPHVGYAIR